MEPESGRFTDLHVSAGVRHIRGSVERLTVTGGATVAIEGIVNGPVTIERGAKLCVDGLFAGWVERNEGLLLIAGQANLDLTQRIGRLALAVGSTVVCTRTRPAGSKVWTLTEEGSLRRISGLRDRAHADSTRLHYFENQPPPLAESPVSATAH